MKREKKIFLGGLNSDDAEYLLPREDYRDCVNMRNTSSRSDEVGNMENMKAIAIQQGTATPGSGSTETSNFCIGSCEDKQNRKVYSFVWNPVGSHYIREYDGSYGTIIITNQILNFDRYHLIDAEVVGDFLYWTDGFNPPRYLNIKRLKADEYPTTLSDDDINLIMKAPNYPLTLTRSQDSSYSLNDINNYSFEFAYRYVYKDGQISVLSPSSVISTPEPLSQNNYIRLNFPVAESIPAFVDKMEIYFMMNKSYTWQLFDKGTVAELISAEIRFYNDTIGDVLSSSELTKHFESIPLKSESLTVAKGRLFLGGNTEAYDTPNVSMSVNVQAFSSSSAVSAPVKVFRAKYWEIETLLHYEYYYLLNGKYYFITSDSTAITDFSSYTSQSHAPGVSFTESQVGIYLNAQGWYGLDWTPTAPNDNTFPEAEDLNPVINVSVLDVMSVLKSRSTYKLGIVFYDKYNRSSGVVTNNSMIAQVPEITSGNYEAIWTIDANNSTIPTWASSYQIVRTKNSRCTSFINYKTNDILYYTGVATDGTNSFSETYILSVKSIYVDVRSMALPDIGYTYQEGDKLDVYYNSTWYILEVTGQDSHYIVCKPQDLGTLTSEIEVNFEVYSPLKKTSAESFYEAGSVYPLHSPGSGATFSETTGKINGDTYMMLRPWAGIDDYTNPSTALYEAMNTNDTYWYLWLDNAGRIKIEVDDVEEKHKTQSIRYSNVFTPGTLNNGLHSFEWSNEDAIPLESGSVQKLVFTSGEQITGNVMLAICSNATSSIYIGESQIVDNYEDSVLAVSNNVIGTIRTLKGGYGTQNPESVKVLNGNVFWWDLHNATVVRYSTNGLFPVSAYKMKSYFRDKAKRIKDLNLQGFYAFGGVDKRNSEYVLSFANYSDTVIDGYTNSWSDAICVLNNGSVTGDYRMKTLTFNKYEDAILMSGYPTSYPITDAFTNTGTLYPGSYSALSNTEFASLSVVDYTTRLISFLNHIITVEQGEYTISNEYEGTDVQICPI